MSEHLAWAQWWAFPWKYAHGDWVGSQYSTIEALYQSGRRVPGHLMDITACLPPAPQPTVLRLALSSNAQLGLALSLVHDTFNPEAVRSLSDNHQQWCIRLSKALPPAMLSPEDDPLRLLHSWLDPTIWQRIRLRFARERANEVEKRHLYLENASSRLDTLWQAVVWRVTSLPGEPIAPGLNR
ncbi:type III secretion protein [Pseudomonas sp. R5-89-07]|uniref:type III secretion protein n=1 Tax=Pseudomonas sp. R5-89-07 TaxID=658644 RepID=UPI000F5763E8|nr:type III secretion protein [Pseudomonas sp. R5-89-07]